MSFIGMINIILNYIGFACFALIFVLISLLFVYLFSKDSNRNRKLKKARKKRKALRKKAEKFRKRIASRKKKEVQNCILTGDTYLNDVRLKAAYYRYLLAKNISKDYDKASIPLCNERLKLVQDLVRFDLNYTLNKLMNNMELLLERGQFEGIHANGKKFIKLVKKHEWAQITDILTNFQAILLGYWKRLFQKMEALADEYYEKKQYGLANVMFSKCKSVAKEFQYGHFRTRLIKVLLIYENRCEIQEKYAKMHAMGEESLILMNLNRKQEALSRLSEVQDL